MGRVGQKHMKLDELTPPASRDAANICCKRDKKYGTTKLNVSVVVQPQMAVDAASSGPTTHREPIKTLDSLLGKFQILQLTS
jgi:hypothetical protein